MIFKRELADKILRGEKTQTRRLIKQGEIANCWHRAGEDDSTINEVLIPRKQKSWLDSAWCSKWVVGKTYAICPGRTAKGVGHIRITKIERQRLRDMWDADVIAEGVPEGRTYTSDEPFGKLWNGINKKPGTRWEDNPEVWVLTFELVKEPDYAPMLGSR